MKENNLGDLTYKLFTKTGNAGHYMFYKAITEDGIPNSPDENGE